MCSGCKERTTEVVFALGRRLPRSLGLSVVVSGIVSGLGATAFSVALRACESRPDGLLETGVGTSVALAVSSSLLL